MHKAVVITHPDDGIFLCNVIGLGMWSKVSLDGLQEAWTFSSEEDARKVVRQWTDGEDGYNEHDFAYAPVETAREGIASVDELLDAGLEELIGHMMPNATPTLN